MWLTSPALCCPKPSQKGGRRNSCSPPWAKGSCWMLFCLVIFTIIELVAQKMDLQELADQDRLCWDSWREWMAGHFLWYLFWGNSSSQQLREDKEGKWCGDVSGFVFHSFVKLQTSVLECNSVFQRHSICKSDFILLIGRHPSPVFWV